MPARRCRGSAILFAAQRYGKQPPAEAEIRIVSEEWRQLQPALWKKWVTEFVGSAERRGRRQRK